MVRFIVFFKKKKAYVVSDNMSLITISSYNIFFSLFIKNNIVFFGFHLFIYFYGVD